MKKLVGITILIFIILILIFGTFLHKKNYKINLTRSLPLGIYQLIKIVDLNRPLTYNDLILFCPPKEVAKYAKEKKYLSFGFSCTSGVVPMLKKVAALPGDVATIKNNYLHVNNQEFKIFTEKEKFFTYNGGKVKDDHLLAMTSAEYGFDSRYFGELNQNIIIGVLIPIFTF